MSRTQGRPLRIGYVCVWDPDYPRNRRIREFLERQDDVVVEVVRRSSRRGRLARLLDDVARPVRTLRRFDVVIVAEYAVVFAPVIAVASLPIGARQDLQASLRLAAMFLAIGALALALWWIGGRIGPLGGIPGWLPLAVTAAGAILAVAPGFLRR